MDTVTRCTECYDEEIIFFWELPMNEEIREYARNYISEPKLYWPDLQSALKAWGNGTE